MSRDKSGVDGVGLRLGQVLGFAIHHPREPAQVPRRGIYENSTTVLQAPLVRITHPTDIEFLDRIASQGSHAISL